MKIKLPDHINLDRSSILQPVQDSIETSKICYNHASLKSESDDMTVNSEMKEDDACLKDIKKAKKSRLLLLNS